MRKNRIGKCPLADISDMKKRERASYSIRSTSNLEIVRWNDNSVVTNGSDAYGVELVRNVKRWIRGEGRGNITQPAVIAAYNCGMAGVDLLDCALSDLRPVFRGKKWYWPLIMNAINIAFLYSWRIYRIIFGEVLSQKEFRRRVVSIMITRSASQVADKIRPDGVRHYPSPAPVRRCTICKKKLP